MTTTARNRAKKNPPNTGPNWDTLLQTATLESKEGPTHRPAVEVPPEVVAYAQKLYTEKKRATFPVDSQEQFEQQKIVWQSAGDKTTPLTSATVTEVRKPRVDSDGKFIYHPLEDADGNTAYETLLDAEGNEVHDDDGNPIYTDTPIYDIDNPVIDLVGLRVSFGVRRGATKKNATATTDDTATEPQNTDTNTDPSNDSTTPEPPTDD